MHRDITIRDGHLVHQGDLENHFERKETSD